MSLPVLVGSHGILPFSFALGGTWDSEVAEVFVSFEGVNNQIPHTILLVCIT